MLTNSRVIERLLPVTATCTPTAVPERWRIEIAPAGDTL
jgi:hypothetical protein